MFNRSLVSVLQARFLEQRRFLQVLVEPRQVGKTTMARQVLEMLGLPSVYASADGPWLEERLWIEQQWDQARLEARSAPSAGALLVLDEVQKVSGWSEVIKRLWDEDTAAGVSLKVLLLGSSPLLMERGLTESQAGRFEVIRAPHWSFSEMENAFGWKLDQFIYFGGYPGAAPLIEDPDRWARYILDSLIETTVSRDILLMSRIEKPALLRRLFQLGCEYSSQVLSYSENARATAGCRQHDHTGSLPGSTVRCRFAGRDFEVLRTTCAAASVESQATGIQYCLDDGSDWALFSRRARKP